MPLLCIQCSKQFTNCKPYLTHLRMQHAVHYIGSIVKCGQDSCPRSFQNFKYLKAHLEKHHADLLSAVENTSNYAANCFECAPDCEGDIVNMDTDASSPNDDTDLTVNLTASLMNLLGQLQCKSNICLTDIQTVVDCMQGFLEDIAGFCVSEVKKMLCSLNIDCSVRAAEVCMAKLNALPVSFNPLQQSIKEKSI